MRNGPVSLSRYSINTIGPFVVFLVWLGNPKGISTPQPCLISLSHTRIFSANSSLHIHPSLISIVMGFLDKFGGESDLNSDVFSLPRSSSLEFPSSNPPSSTSRTSTNPRSLMRFWAEPLPSTPLTNTRNTAKRTASPKAMPLPKNCCKSPSVNDLRHRTMLSCGTSQGLDLLVLSSTGKLRPGG